MDAIFQIIILFAFATIAGAFIQGLFFPTKGLDTNADVDIKNRKPTTSNKSAEVGPNKSILNEWKESRWFWNVSQFLFVVSLKVVTVLVLLYFKFDVANDATSLLPILLNVWLSRYLLFQKKLNMSRWVIGGVIYFAQVMLGLSIGIFSA